MTKLDDLADRYIELKAEHSRLEQKKKDIKSQMDEIEREWARRAEEQGMDRFAAGSLTVSVKDEITFRHKPECWNEFLKTCVDAGRFDAVQKRPSSKVLEELVGQGVLSPELLHIDTYKKVSVRNQ